MSKKHKAYPKYKSSGIDWIGDIPEHWEVRRLKFIMGYCKGKNPEFLTSVNGLDYLPYLSMAYLRNLVSIDDVLYTKMEKGLIQVEEGDILLLWDGANAGEIIKGKKGFLSSTMAKLDFKLNISKSYSFYVLKYLEKTLRKDIVGMGIPHVNSKQLNNLPLLLPELLEQKQIADYLDHQTSLIDEAVSKSKELIEKLKEKRIALISSVVCGKIDVRGSD